MLQIQKDVELAEHPPMPATVLSDASELGSMKAGWKEWWMLYPEKNRLRGDVITDFGLGGMLYGGWRPAVLHLQ